MDSDGADPDHKAQADASSNSRCAYAHLAHLKPAQVALTSHRLPGDARGPSVSAAPGDRRPDALVKIIPKDLGQDLEGGNQTRDLDLAGQEPADRKRVERSQCPPTDGLKDRPCVCLCSAERTHQVCLLSLTIINVSRRHLLPALVRRADHAILSLAITPRREDAGLWVQRRAG